MVHLGIADTIPAATNWCTNPSAEENTTGWTPDRCTVGRISSKRWAGEWSFRSVVTDATTGSGPYVRFGGIPAVSGDTVTVSGRVACLRPGTEARFIIDFRNSGGTVLSTSTLTWFPMESEANWARLDHSAIAPATTATATVAPQMNNAGTTPVQVDDVFWFDGVDVRVNQPYDAYIDGDQDGCVWNGTAHASTSTRAEAATQGPTGRGSVYRVTSRTYLADIDNTRGTEITDHVLAGSVDTDVTRQAEKSLLKLTVDDPLIVMPPYGFVAPFTDVMHENGDVITAQLGLFQVQQPKISLNRTAGDYGADVDGTDLVGWLATRIFNGRTTIPNGQNCATSVRNLISGEGISRHDIPDLGRAMSYTRTYLKGTSILAAINRQLRSAGCHPLFMRGDGFVTSVPYRSINADEPVRTYTLGEDSQIASEMTVERDDSELFNVVQLTRNDPAKGTTLIAIARNDDPDSPSSTVNIGERARPATVVNDAVDYETLQELAQWELDRSSVQVQLQLDVLPDPELSIHQVIYIQLTDTQWLDLVKRQAAGRWFITKVAHGLDYTAGTRLTCRRTLSAERATRV